MFCTWLVSRKLTSPRDNQDDLHVAAFLHVAPRTLYGSGIGEVHGTNLLSPDMQHKQHQ